MEAAAKVYKDIARAQWRDQLILDHLTYVRHIVRKMIAQLPEGIDEENLEAAGILGLVEAAQQFEPQREVEFKTFAFQRIRGAILDELRRNSPLPQKLVKQISLVRRVCQELTPPVTPEAIANQDRIETGRGGTLSRGDAAHQAGAARRRARGVGKYRRSPSQPSIL